MGLAALVPLFAPYCGGMAQQQQLHDALAQLALGSWQGERSLVGGKGHAYQLLWQGESAPLEQLSCRLLFPAFPDLQYSFDLQSHQLVLWLMQQEAGDLPQAFWRWLLLGQAVEGSA